jgi:hypothetical protein
MREKGEVPRAVAKIELDPDAAFYVQKMSCTRPITNSRAKFRFYIFSPPLGAKDA